MPAPNHRTIPSQSINNSLNIKPVKKSKKIAVKLPKLDQRRLDGHHTAQDTELEPSIPPEISTINTSITHLNEALDDNVIDIYLPGRDAWDAIKQRAITNQLHRLGIQTTPTPTEQKYDVSFDSTPTHSKSMSFGSDLLDFKMDKFFNNSGPEKDLSLKPPGSLNRHSSSLSLSNFNTTNLSPALSSPSSYFPHSPLSPSASNASHLNIPGTPGPPSNASHNPSSLPDVEEEEEEEDKTEHVDKLDDTADVKSENNADVADQVDTQEYHDQQHVDKQLDNASVHSDEHNTSVVPDEAPQLPAPSFQELSRGFGYELDYEEEQAQLAEMDKEENKHKKSYSGFTIKSANQDDDSVQDEDDVNEVEDMVKSVDGGLHSLHEQCRHSNAAQDQMTTDTNTNTNTETDDTAFNYELQRQEVAEDEEEAHHYQPGFENDQEQENTIKPATALNSALKPTVAEFIPSVPFKDSTNNYSSSTFKFGMQQAPQEYDEGATQPAKPVEIPTNKRARALSGATSGDGDNWSGFDVNSDGGDLDTFSNPSDEERVLQRRFNNRMMSNTAFQFGGMEGIPATSAPLNRKTSLSANAPAFEPGNFTFKSELSMNKGLQPDASLVTTDSKESEIPYKRGRPNPSASSAPSNPTSPRTQNQTQAQLQEWRMPFSIKQEPVEEDLYDGAQSSSERDESRDSRVNFSLQDVYYKLEQLSINLKARDVLTRDDLHNAIENDRGVILEGLDRLNEASQHASSMDRLTLLADLLAGLKPQIASLRPDEHALAARLSEAVTPGIQTLVDLASDKKETAALITEHLTQSDMFASIKTTLTDMLNRHSELYDSFHSTQSEIFTNASSLQAKLGDLPSGLGEATVALQAATSKLDGYSKLSEDLTEMRTYVTENSELRNEISKAQSLHGKLRSEKDRILDRLRVVEEERDSAKMEADLSRQAARKVESDLVKIEATNGSLIESLNGMSNKTAQFEHQLADLFDQKHAWYAADRDYQVRVKELEMEQQMQRREFDHVREAREEEARRLSQQSQHSEELARLLHSSRIEIERLSTEYDNMSASSIAVNQDLMARNAFLEARSKELEETVNRARENEQQHQHAHRSTTQHIAELEDKSTRDKELLEEATNTIERLYQEMSATNHENAELKKVNEDLKFSRDMEDGRRTPTNNMNKAGKANGVITSQHAPAPAYNTPVSPAYSSTSKLSTSTAATYQADDGWFYAN
ncbi:hypothetical protein E3P99_00491 [Wallemia hederae]|uniref:Uncharacterized protein n=1 Tax=Wallemia hederae TaxID=1540922 RepID=A0A4T0FVH4_9BASI|nr:hypothetical protein E3P99_00491 [Wallemia hederae]